MFEARRAPATEPPGPPAAPRPAHGLVSGTRHEQGLFLGIDVGSTTVKLVAVGPTGQLLAHRYVRANGQPRETLLRASGLLNEELRGAPPLGVGLTGSGGEPVARIIGGVHANELVTQSRAIGAWHPEVRTVIEIGGQDSKYLSVRWDQARGQMTLLDFAMNTLCAAGTGSFLDQQAQRLGIAIDEEFARIALDSRSPARIAGRCTVFAKSDMIHLQQEGVPLSDILAGLCLALARNFKSVIGKGKSFTPPVLFQGGVARNAAVARAFEDVLGLDPGGLVVPEHPDLMAAIGAALLARDERREGREHPFHGFGALEASLRDRPDPERNLPPLAPCPAAVTLDPRVPRPGGGAPTLVCLGVDVGSISTNVVLLDEDDRVVARRYLPTAGDPIGAVRRGLTEVGEEAGARVRVVGAGVTGSGRHLSGYFVGADVVRNEITAQARAAVAAVPGADTVIEIGGQDSKYIRLSRGVVVDFAMNNACAAGTGSFLEEQADRLGLSVETEFAEKALAAPAPSCLGERCTVFMESDLVHHQQRGALLENLTAGLAYSIVRNYLNRVVNSRPMGERILFQGGVAHNASVVSAFESVLGHPVTVPPHHDVTGAIGAAILAREARAARPGERTKFRGFDVADRPHATRSFVCRACPNLCDVQRVTVSDDAPLFFGARCERFEEAGRDRAKGPESIRDLFAERSALLIGDHQDPGSRSPHRRRIGIPRALTFHELFPFWRAFFRHLDMDVVLSDETNPRIVQQTARTAASETCFPVKLVSGTRPEPSGEGRRRRLPAGRTRPGGSLSRAAPQPLLPPHPGLRIHGRGPARDREAWGAGPGFPVPPAAASDASSRAEGRGPPPGGAARRGPGRGRPGGRGAASLLRGRAEARGGRTGRAGRGRPPRGRRGGPPLQHLRPRRLPEPAPEAPEAGRAAHPHRLSGGRSGRPGAGAHGHVLAERSGDPRNRRHRFRAPPSPVHLPDELPLWSRLVSAHVLPACHERQALPRARARRPHRRSRNPHAVRGLSGQPGRRTGDKLMSAAPSRTIFLPRMSDHPAGMAAAMRSLGVRAEALPPPESRIDGPRAERLPRTGVPSLLLLRRGHPSQVPRAGIRPRQGRLLPPHRARPVPLRPVPRPPRERPQRPGRGTRGDRLADHRRLVCALW